jgi:LPS sulfotransferase NodH
MITCPARTGSTMLVHLLRSHPDICSHCEVFSPNKITGITGTYLRKSREQPDLIERLTVERDRDPVKFLYKIVLDLQGKQIAGFKLKHDELVLPGFSKLRDEILSDLDFRIIHLRRENLLRRYLSHYIVNHVTRVTLAVLNQPIPVVPPVLLDPLECERDFVKVRTREAEFAEVFALHRNFSISYEEIVAAEAAKMAALQDFLGVSWRELTTTTKKLGKSSLRSAIENFDELRDYFANTDFAGFFEET